MRCSIYNVVRAPKSLTRRFLFHLCLIGLWVGGVDVTAASTGTSDLPDGYYHQWLDQVNPLLDDEERDAFLSLISDAQREAFMQAFWRSRDDDPSTPYNPRRERYERQLMDAANRFGNLQDDRAQMTFLHGAPRYVHHVQCPLLKPLYLFYFPRNAQRDTPFTALFTPSKSDPERFELWPAGRKHGFLSRDYEASGLPLAEMLDAANEAQCFQGQEQVRGFLGGALEDAIDWQKARAMSYFPSPGTEWLVDFQAELRGDGVDARGEVPAGGTLGLVFPARQGGRTVIQGHVQLPREVLAAWLDQSDGSGSGATLDSSFTLSGQLERLDPSKAEIEAGVIPRHLFRQRFHLGKAGASVQDSERVSLYFFRDAPAGSYVLVVRLQAPDGSTLLRDFRQIDIPREPDALASAPPSGAIEIAPENLAILANRPGIQIVPMPALQIGLRTVQVVTSGHGIDRVRFALDERPVGSDDAAPWGLEVDFGTEPKPRLLQVEALDAEGKVVAGDLMRVNAGAHRFDVRIIEPRQGDQIQDLMRVKAAVEVPTGSDLERVEFLLEETPVEVLYQPPFVTMMALDRFQQATYVKTVAYLTDGSVTSDLVLINVPGEVEEIDVREVDLFANVFDRRQRSVDGLQLENFRVLEDGIEQTLQRVERVEDLPVHIAFLVDSSSSMVDELPLTIESSLRFFSTVLTPEDQASVVTFNHNTRLAVPFTRDLDWLADGVSTLGAYGGTAVWDSVVSTLHYFGGLEGKRAMILLSDGDDQHSRFEYPAVREFAQRAGVAIYAVSMNVGWEVPDNDMPNLNGQDPTRGTGVQAWELKRRQHQSRLEKLAKDTGGLYFKIASIKTLDKALQAIGEDVRSQYLLTYQSSHQGDSFRQVDVRTLPKKLKVRSVGGYYP